MRTVSSYKKFFISATAVCALGSGLLLASAQQVHAQSAGLVISQIYAAGGNSGATYNRDFIELFNGTGTSIDLTGYTLQYASAGGVFQTTGNQVTSLSGSIASGGYLLIGGASGSNGVALPSTVDISGAVDLGGSGKLAIANNSTLVTFTAGSSMFSNNVVDFVGFGTTASAYEGAGRAPSPSTTNSILRASFTPSGSPTPTNYQDSNNNNLDFATSAVSSPGPRNRASATFPNFVASMDTPEPGTFALGLTALPILGSIGLRRRALSRKARVAAHA